MKLTRLLRANDNPIGYDSTVQNIETNQANVVTWCSAWSDVVSVLWNDGYEEDNIPVKLLKLI